MGADSPEVVALGETMLRLTTPPGLGLEQSETLRAEVAGAESNVAIGLSRLGLRTGWISRLPQSPLGRRVVNKVREHGVDTSRVIWSEQGRLGTYYVELGSRPRPTRVLYDRSGSAMALINPDEVDWEYLRGVRLLHLSGITPALSPSCRDLASRAAQEARNAGCGISFDVNYRARLWGTDEARRVLGELVRGVEVLFSTREEAEILSDEAEDLEELARAIGESFEVGVTVITDGNRGTVAARDGITYRGETHGVEAVDRVGAGDAFDAGFLFGYLRDGVEQGLAFGAALASLQHSFLGDIAWSTEQDLLNLIEQGGEEAWR